MIDIIHFASRLRELRSQNKIVDVNLDDVAERDNDDPSRRIYYNNDENGSLVFGGDIGMDPKYVIVTDASSQQVDGEIYSASAGIIIDMETNDRYTFSEFLDVGRDTAYAELFAIQYAIREIMDRSYKLTGILIFSDSEGSVNYLNSDGKIKESSTKAVEEIRKWLKSYLLHNKLYVTKAVHIKSHTSDLNKMRNHFKKAGLNFNDKTIRTLIDLNHEVDHLAGETLKDGLRKRKLII